MFVPLTAAQTSAPEVVDAPVTAQHSITPDVIALTASSNQRLIAAKTSVLFTLDSSVGSKTSLPGDFFRLKVAEALKVNDQILIPAGTPATGEVIHAQKAGSFGKAGELIVTIRYIELNGQKIKMRSFKPLVGKDKTRAVFAATLAIGVFSGFIRGGEIEIPADTFVQALIAADSIVAAPLAPALHNNEQPITSEMPTTGDSK